MDSDFPALILSSPVPQRGGVFHLICYRFLTRQGIDYLIMPAMFSRLSLRAVREEEIEGRGTVVLAATCSEYKGEGRSSDLPGQSFVSPINNIVIELCATIYFY